MRNAGNLEVVFENPRIGSSILSLGIKKIKGLWQVVLNPFLFLLEIYLSISSFILIYKALKISF
jgi:hypothetical protein